VIALLLIGFRSRLFLAGYSTVTPQGIKVTPAPGVHRRRISFAHHCGRDPVCFRWISCLECRRQISRWLAFQILSRATIVDALSAVAKRGNPAEADRITPSDEQDEIATPVTPEQVSP